MIRMHLSTLATLLAVATASSALAGTVPLPLAARDSNSFTSAISVDVAYLVGQAREHAFFNGYSERIFPDRRRHQASRLDWEMEDVFLLGLSSSVRIGLASLNIGVWGGLGAEDSGTMEDYDWLMGDSRELHGPLSEGASEYSRSDDTVTSAWMADANVSFDLLDRDCAFSLFPFVGLRCERYEWEEKLEFACYSFNGWDRKDYGGMRSIEYRQVYFQPYVGLGTSWTADRLVLAAYGRFAPVYWGKAHDNHLLRGFVSDHETVCDFFGDVAYGLGARAGWVFTKNLSANVGIDWTRYSLAEAELYILDQDDSGGSGEMGIGKNLSGMELQYLTVSANLAWRF